MADVLRNGLGYFFQGVKDCLYGLVRIYEFQKGADQNEANAADQSKPMSVLAQRRAAAAAASPSTPVPPKKIHEPKITHRIFECCLWNGGIFWLSLVLFDYVFVPTLKTSTYFILGGSELYNHFWSWMAPTLSAIFSALWVIPLFIVSKVVNSLWFQDIADAAWKTKRRQQKLPNIGLLVADMLFSILVQTLFLFQSMIADMIPLPLIGQVVSLIHLAVLYSMYAFEYRWFNAGWNIKQRVAQLEYQWPYFLGFGLPLAYLTWISQSIFISGCVFAIVFPLMIVSANEAPPIRHKFDFPLHLFGVVMHLSDIIFRFLPSSSPPKSSSRSR